jgi:hypothetical protein
MDYSRNNTDNREVVWGCSSFSVIEEEYGCDGDDNNDNNEVIMRPQLKHDEWYGDSKNQRVPHAALFCGNHAGGLEA